LIAGLIGDIADCLGSSISPLLTQQWVYQLCTYLQQ